MNKKKMIKRAKRIKKDSGGKVFAFPIDRDDPFSKYVLVLDLGVEFNVFPEKLDITEVAQCIFEAIQIFERNGFKISYEEDVRFVVYEAQMNAPSVTMRRLRDGQNFRGYR